VPTLEQIVDIERAKPQICREMPKKSNVIEPKIKWRYERINFNASAYYLRRRAVSGASVEDRREGRI
jgi:hypothetical protein